MIENESSFMAPAPLADAHTFEAYTVFGRFEHWLETLLHRVPVSLPAGWPENIARTAPWVSLAFLPLHALATLALLGFTALGALMGSFAFLSLVLGIGILVCDVVALPGLFARSRKGWAFLVYADLLMALDGVLSLSLFRLATSAFVLWLAMQVKPQYRK